MNIRTAGSLSLYTLMAFGLVAGFLMANAIDRKEIAFENQVAKAATLASHNRPARLRATIFQALQHRAGARLSFRDKRKLASAIARSAVLYNTDPALIMAVIETESSYRSRAVSSVGAVGLMQVRPFVARGLSDEMNISPPKQGELYGAYTNVMIGSYYLTKMLRRFNGDLTLALEAYNQGPTALRARLSSGLPPVGRYTNKVLKARERIKRVIATSSAA